MASPPLLKYKLVVPSAIPTSVPPDGRFPSGEQESEYPRTHCRVDRSQTQTLLSEVRVNAPAVDHPSGVPFQWVDVDSDPLVELLRARRARRPSVPVTAITQGPEPDRAFGPHSTTNPASLDPRPVRPEERLSEGQSHRVAVSPMAMASLPSTRPADSCRIASAASSSG